MCEGLWFSCEPTLWLALWSQRPVQWDSAEEVGSGFQVGFICFAFTETSSACLGGGIFENTSSLKQERYCILDGKQMGTLVYFFKLCIIFVLLNITRKQIVSQWIVKMAKVTFDQWDDQVVAIFGQFFSFNETQKWMTRIKTNSLLSINYYQ